MKKEKIKVPFLDLSAAYQELKNEIDDAVLRVMNSGWFILGPEVDAFEKQYGYKPTQIGTSIDMLAVYVNKDNPVKGLSLAQVDAIFSFYFSFLMVDG